MGLLMKRQSHALVPFELSSEHDYLHAMDCILNGLSAASTLAIPSCVFVKAMMQPKREKAAAAQALH